MYVPSFLPEAPKKDSREIQYLEEKTGYNLDITWIPQSANFNQKIAAAMAADDVPSALLVGQPGEEMNRKAMETGYFWELKDKIGSHSQLSSIPDRVITAALYKGGLYGLPRLRDQARGGIIVRKDWMENLGLEAPKNMDDLYKIIKAMTTQDPDGNGKDDTYGFNFRHSLWGFPIMAAWYGAGADWSFRDGEIVRNHETSEFMDALKWGRRLNEENLIPGDWPAQTYAIFDQRFWSGEVGVILNVVDGINQHLAKVQEVNPEANLDFYMMLDAGKGKIQYASGAGYAGLWSFPKTSCKTEEDLEKHLDFFNKISTEDMHTFFRWGIEGTHFKRAGQGAEFTKRKSYEDRVAPLKQLQIYYPTSGGLPPADPTAIQEKLMRIQQGEALKYLVVDDTIGLDSPTYTETRGELKQLRRDAWIKYVSGNIDEDEYWDSIQTWLDAGGAQAKKEFTEEFLKYKQ
jgi:putative aldouronate transport system substrate-binding protein